MWDSRNEGAWEGWAQLEPLSCAGKTQDDLSASLKDSVGRLRSLDLSLPAKAVSVCSQQGSEMVWCVF